MKIKLPKTVEETQLKSYDVELPIFLKLQKSHVKLFEEKGEKLYMEIWYPIIKDTTLVPPRIEINSIEGLSAYLADPLHDFFNNRKSDFKASSQEAFNKALKDASSQFHAFLDFHLGNEKVKGRPTTEMPKPQPHVTRS